jgi:sulfur-oxidizing protein SoxY
MTPLLRLAAGAGLAWLAAALPASAGEAWESLRPMIYGDRPIEAAGAALALDAPYRTQDDARAPLGARLDLPEGVRATRLSLIIDDNPMPVSAVFDFAAPREDFAFTATMRLDGPTPVRAVVETEDGRLLMTEAMVKTSGQGACAAPPVTDPETALATLGRMEFRPHAGGDAGARLAALAGTGPAMGELSIRHPSHSGLQMDQVSLLHIPARYVQTVEIREDGSPAFTLTGSISLSEDPAVAFTYAPGPVEVRVTDTEGAVFERRFDPAGS